MHLFSFFTILTHPLPLVNGEGAVGFSPLDKMQRTCYYIYAGHRNNIYNGEL